MFGLNIEFGFDELPANGTCSICQLPIQGIMFVPYIQVGDVKDAKHLDPICESCYREKLEDTPDQQ